MPTPPSAPDGAPRRAFVGDVHGCLDELHDLFDAIGFTLGGPADTDRVNEVWFVGDLVNTGPRSDGVLALVAALLRDGRGGFVLGNHDDNVYRALRNEPGASERTRETLAQIDRGSAAGGTIDRAAALSLFENAPLTRHFVDSGILLVHAAPPSPDADAAENRRTTLYGPVAEGTTKDGRPRRLNWARGWTGDDFVVFGHSPHRAPAIFGHAVCLDTGCVYGGSLTAWLPHEARCVGVPARQRYADGRLRESSSDGPYL